MILGLVNFLVNNWINQTNNGNNFKINREAANNNNAGTNKENWSKYRSVPYSPNKTDPCSCNCQNNKKIKIRITVSI